MPRNYQRHRFIDSLQDEERRAAESDRNPNAYMGTGWRPDTSIKGRVFRLTCALSDSQDKAIRSLKHELGSIPLEAVWPILKDICYDLGLFIGGGGAVGAVAGAVAATFATGGVGTVPGAVAGAYLGTQAGSLCMVFIGLEEVVFYLFKALPNAAEYYKRGFNSAMSGSPFAANDFADGHVLMVKAILAGIVFYLTAGKGKLPELLQKIRTSKKLGAKFATWVEQNEKILVNNSELQRPNFNSRNKCIGLCANSKAQQKTEVKIVSDDDFGHRGVTQKDTGPAMTPRQLVAEKAKMEKEMAMEAAENKTIFNRQKVRELGIPKNLSARQELHLPPVTDGRSVLTQDPAKLLQGLQEGEFSILRQPKSGQVIVDFGKPIGEFWSKASGEPINMGITNFGSVMYGKNGVHIIPANPKQW